MNLLIIEDLFQKICKINTRGGDHDGKKPCFSSPKKFLFLQNKNILTIGFFKAQNPKKYCESSDQELNAL